MDQQRQQIPSPDSAHAPRLSSPPDGAPVWRYGLKHLLGLMTILCFLFAWIGASSLGVGIAIALGALFVAAHFLGAIVGTRLRASAPTRAQTLRASIHRGEEPNEGE